MIARVDLHATVESASGHDRLRMYLQQLVGQPFLLLRFSYGDELTVHLGEPRQYRSPKMSDSKKGSYIVAARASSWFLKTGSPPRVMAGLSRPIPFRSKDLVHLTPVQAEKSESLKIGARVLCAEVFAFSEGRDTADAFGLAVLLEEGASLLILPSATSRRGTQLADVADWEVFTPHERYLRVGPGLRWSYLPSRTSRRKPV